MRRRKKVVPRVWEVFECITCHNRMVSDSGKPRRCKECGAFSAWINKVSQLRKGD